MAKCTFALAGMSERSERIGEGVWLSAVQKRSSRLVQAENFLKEEWTPR